MSHGPPQSQPRFRAGANAEYVDPAAHLNGNSLRQMSEANVQRALVCPITQCPMVDPVMDKVRGCTAPCMIHPVHTCAETRSHTMQTRPRACFRVAHSRLKHHCHEGGLHVREECDPRVADASFDFARHSQPSQRCGSHSKSVGHSDTPLLPSQSAFPHGSMNVHLRCALMLHAAERFDELALHMWCVS